MNCQQSRKAIALKVGHDLDLATQRELKRHLQECPHCRQHHREMLSSIKALQFAEHHTDVIDSESLWPEVSLRIQSHKPGARPQRFNGWIPAAGVLAACLLIAVVSNQRPRVSPVFDDTNAISVTPAVSRGTVPVGPSLIWDRSYSNSLTDGGSPWSPQRSVDRSKADKERPEELESPLSEVHIR